MTIQITGTVIERTARNGTMIGKISVAPPRTAMTTYELQSNPNGYFVLAANGELYNTWNGGAIVGNYTIKIYAHGAGFVEYGDLVIRIVPESINT